MTVITKQKHEAHLLRNRSTTRAHYSRNETTWIADTPTVAPPAGSAALVESEDFAALARVADVATVKKDGSSLANPTRYCSAH